MSGTSLNQPIEKSSYFAVGNVRIYIKGYCDSLLTGGNVLDFRKGTFEYLIIEEVPQDTMEGVALQPATPAVCNAPENTMQS